MRLDLKSKSGIYLPLYIQSPPENNLEYEAFYNEGEKIKTLSQLSPWRYTYELGGNNTTCNSIPLNKITRRCLSLMQLANSINNEIPNE